MNGNQGVQDQGARAHGADEGVGEDEGALEADQESNDSESEGTSTDD